MKILISGGTSFIGQALVRNLLSMLPTPEIITLQRSSCDIDSIETIYHDLRAPMNPRIIERLVGTDVIVHAAAVVSAGTSIEFPVETVEANVMGTFHMLEAAREIKPQRFVFISTGEVLGHVPSPLVVDESAPLRPSDPYGASKAAGEEICRSWRMSFGVPTIVVRPMNVFGPGQRLPRFIPTIIQKMMRRESVFCNVSKYGDIEVRNRMHVDECCRWLVKIIDRGVPGETYHVFGPEIDNLKVIQTIGDLFPGCCNYQFRVVPGRDIRYSAKDTKLGITLSVDDMLEHLIDTVEWYKENPACLASS